MSLNLYSQTQDSTLQRNAVFYEFAGVGGAHTMNYERIFVGKKLVSFSARIGIGFSDLIDYYGHFNPNMTIPALINMSIGKKHKVEVGVGQALSSIPEVNTKTGDPDRGSYFSTVFNLGYRYQRPGKPFLFRVAYTPIIEFNEKFTHWVGVSIGYLF
tara:strand:+ start:84 stop:554 length:471 start_codon:yes stop_codon:yes gene_type:complete